MDRPAPRAIAARCWNANCSFGEHETALIALTLLAFGCNDDTACPGPCDGTLGARAMAGCRLARGAQPALDTQYIGFLVSSDKPGHFSVGWMDALGAATRFSGTVAVDGVIVPGSTHGHIGDEMVRFDAANQISFESAPGSDVAGVDLTTDSDTIYLDGYLNGSRLGFQARFPYLDCYLDSVGDWQVQQTPIAFGPQN
jgi:hypothetical protein